MPEKILQAFTENDEMNQSDNKKLVIRLLQHRYYSLMNFIN